MENVMWNTARGIVVGLIALSSVGCGEKDVVKQPELSSVAKTAMLSVPRNTTEQKMFCGQMLLTYDNMTAFTDATVQKEVRYYKFLEENGYVVAGRKEFALMANPKYGFTPTEKLWALADRRDGDCFYSNSPSYSNVKVTAESQHPQYKTVWTVYLTYDMAPSKYQAFYMQGHGNITDGKWQRRVLVLEDPFSKGFQIKAVDVASMNTWYSTNVPDAYAMINLGGIDALRQ
jgi:hypothetical protein